MVVSDNCRRGMRSLLLVLRLSALATILAGPIAAGAWAVYAGDRVPSGYAEVHPDEAAGPLAAHVSHYLARRHPVVDRLLPDGFGGTRFFEDLDGKAGVAFVNVPAIGLAATTVNDPGWPEATELHERAHLVYAFLPEEVSRLMARVRPPQPDEYAATNRSEHLAEMAGAAWEIVAAPQLFTVYGSPVERLHDAESRIPGTAGFVAWYLQALEPGEVRDYDALSRAAAALTAPDREEWDALWQAIDQRRLPGGTFEPWSYRTVRDYLERQRAAARISPMWIDRIGGHLLIPSLTVLTIAGR